MPPHDARDPAAEAVLVTTRIVRKGSEHAYRSWVDRVRRAAEAAPDYRGSLALEQSGGLFHLVHRFASRGALDRWRGSAPLAALMREAERFAVPRDQIAQGAGATLTLPAESDSAKWKRFLMTWAAVYPLVTLLNLALKALPVALPVPVQTAVSSATMVAAMTWFILPAVSRRLKPWMMRGSDGAARTGE